MKNKLFALAVTLPLLALSSAFANPPSIGVKDASNTTQQIMQNGAGTAINPYSGVTSIADPTTATQQAAVPASGADGVSNSTAALMTYGLGMGFNGATWDRLQVDGSKNLKVNINAASSTIGATQSGTWTVQPGNTANTTPWLTTISQGGNSATVTGANALKIDGSAVTQPVSGTITANAGSGTFTVSGTVTANAGTGTFATSAPADSSASISIASSSGTQSITGLNGTGTLTVYLSSLGTGGSVVFEGSADGSNWVGLQGTNIATGSTLVSSTSSAGAWQFDIGGLQAVRVRATALTSGTIAGTMRASVAQSAVSLDAPIPTGANTIGAVTQASGPWTNNITQVGGSSLALGQTTMSASLPVTVASNQSGIPVTGTFWQATQPVSLSSLPSLAAGTAYVGKVRPTDGTNDITLNTAPADASSNTVNTIPVLAYNLGFNGTTWDRLKDDSNKYLFVDLGTAIPAGSNTIGAVTQASGPWTSNITQIGGTSIVTGGVNGSQGVGGLAASGASASGNPLQTGYVAATSLPTAVSNAQMVAGMSDKYGRSVVLPEAPRDLEVHQQTTITSSVSETTVLSSVASTFLDITHIDITNSSSTATLVTLKDSTAGTTQAIYSIAANGGISIAFPVPMAQTTAGNNWTVTCGTSVASIYVNITAVKNK